MRGPRGTHTSGMAAQALGRPAPAGAKSGARADPKKAKQTGGGSRLRQLKDVALGVVTAIGGFVDAGQVITSTQAGAVFRWSLLWVVPLCVVLATLYEEMAARVAMSTKRAHFDTVRERLGFRLALVPLLAMCAVNLLTLVAEVAGMAFALEIATGLRYLAWILPCALLTWLVLWKGSFTLIENGASILGLTTLVFLAAAFKLHARWGEIGHAMWKPALHGHPWTLYVYLSIALIGAYVSPYQVLFYSSGAIEEEWDQEYRWSNRIIASLGSVFGGAAAAGITIIAAMVLFPKGITKIDQFAIAAAGPVAAFGIKGFWIFIAGLFFCSLAAGLEVALAGTYAVTEYFGWHWKKDEPPVRSAMFHLVAILFILFSLIVLATGLDPLKITQAAMLFNAVALPFTLFPLLLVAGDPRFTKPPLTSGWLSQGLGWFFFVILTIAALVGLPLFFVTGGGG